MRVQHDSGGKTSSARVPLHSDDVTAQWQPQEEYSCWEKASGEFPFLAAQCYNIIVIVETGLSSCFSTSAYHNNISDLFSFALLHWQDLAKNRWGMYMLTFAAQSQVLAGNPSPFMF